MLHPATGTHQISFSSPSMQGSLVMKAEQEAVFLCRFSKEVL